MANHVSKDQISHVIPISELGNVQYCMIHNTPFYMNIHIYDFCEIGQYCKGPILQSPPIAIIFQQRCHQCVINLHRIHECIIRIKFATAIIINISTALPLTTSKLEFHMSSNVQYCMIHNTQIYITIYTLSMRNSTIYY